MIRNAAPLRASTSALRSSSSTIRSTAGRRFVSTAPPTQKSRSWKSLFARWALAGGAVYYYNTSPVFAEEPLSHYTLRPDPTEETSNLETLDSVVNATSKRRNNSILQSIATAAKPEPIPTKSDSPPAESDLLHKDEKTDASKSDDKSVATEKEEGGESAQFEAGSAEALEAEAGQEGAFNPETGEINWDCPCLGGMAHGPCGEEFKTAFSCFVYSTEEPKGMDCIEKFKGMQDCFRQYPEVYGAELEDDDEEAAEGAAQPASGEEQSVTGRAKAEAAKSNESEDVVPKSAHDTTALNGKAN